jgi:hypothetical protein
LYQHIFDVWRLQDCLRTSEGHPRVVKLLGGDLTSDVAHRCLVLCQVLGDKELDRKALLASGISTALQRYLSPEIAVEVKELALSAVCNIAAGSQMGKQQLAEDGFVTPLLSILQPGQDRILMQLAALALRNLSRNTTCRNEISRLGGVKSLLAFLGEGLDQLMFPLHCAVCVPQYDCQALGGSHRVRSAATPTTCPPSVQAVACYAGDIPPSGRQRRPDSVSTWTHGV